MQLEILTSPARLAELEPAWWELWRASPRSTPFSSPAWQLPWLSRFARRAELCALCVRSAAGLEALLPLFAFRWRGERRAAPVGVGISDYLDVVLGASPPAEVLRLLKQGLELVARDVDCLELEDVPYASPLCELVRSVAGAGLERHGVCPVLGLAGYAARLPRALRRSLSRGHRALASARIVAWHCADDSSIDPLLSALFELHTALWNARGAPGVLGDPDVQSFHREAAPRLLRAGLLRLFVLEIEGSPAGALYVLQGRDAYLYASGYRPELGHLGIGNLLIEHALADAGSSGKRRGDFLRGSEAYKYAWGAKDEITERISIRKAAA
jgi:CelD/BcsL family acetyltransferase involved in cellulose biosynthesis